MAATLKTTFRGSVSAKASRSDSITYADFGAYAGATGEGLRDGRGHYSFANPYFKYNGEWAEGVAHGEGMLKMADGSSYEGALVEGEMTGFGLRRWPDGASYSGQFEQGEMHGQGIYIAPSGEQYEGAYASNRRSGEGILTLATGDRYEGQFERHRRHGSGAIAYANGDAFRGGWEADKRSGAGTLQLAEGGVYEGAFADDAPHGAGAYSQPSGYGYDGPWRSGAPTRLATRLLPSLWVSPAARLVVSGLRGAHFPAPPEDEAAEGATLTVRAALVLPDAAAAAEPAEPTESAPAVHAAEPAWEGALPALALPAGSARPATLRLSVHAASGDELAAATVTLGEHYASCDPGAAGALEAVPLALAAPPAEAEEGAEPPPPPTLSFEYEVSLPPPPEPEAPAAEAPAAEAAAPADEAPAAATAAEAGCEGDGEEEGGEELAEEAEPSPPALEGHAGALLPGLVLRRVAQAVLRLVRERWEETPPSEEVLAAEPEAAPTKTRFVHATPHERGRLLRLQLRKLAGDEAEAAAAAAAAAAEAPSKDKKGGKKDDKKDKKGGKSTPARTPTPPATPADAPAADAPPEVTEWELGAALCEAGAVELRGFVVPEEVPTAQMELVVTDATDVPAWLQLPRFPALHFPLSTTAKPPAELPADA